MRIGIIDLGTNSVRFDVHQIGPGRAVRRLHREKIMVRLGEGVFLNGTLDRDAADRTTQAFLRFKRIAQRLKAGKILAFGTSALREATDQERFVRSIEEKTGIRIRVISGKEEAALIATGILSHERVPGKAPGRAPGRASGKASGKAKDRKALFALVDIGGGSTEITICRDKKVLRSASFPVGTARIQQLFLKKSPPSKEGLQNAREYIRTVLSDIMAAEQWPKAQRILGSSGTIRAIDRIYRHSGEKGPIELKWLRQLNRKLASLTTHQLLGVPGMEEKRVDMILAGSVLFEECMEAVGAGKASVTEYSLRDGILEEEIRLLRKGGGSHLSLHIDDLIEKATRFGLEQGYLQRVVRLAEELFDSLGALHRLDPKWRIYLIAAAVLRDTGEAISLAGHAAHSAYVVAHSDLLGTEEWETDLITRLVAHHEDLKFSPEVTRGISLVSRQGAVRKLLGLLCLLDELDSGPEAEVRIRGARVSRGQCAVGFGGRALTGLEEINVARRSSLFKKVFGREIIAEKG